MDGTWVPMLVAVADVTAATWLLKAGRSLVAVGSKFVPVIVNAVPDTPTCWHGKLGQLGGGVQLPVVKSVMVGAPQPTVKFLPLLSDPTVTVTAPVIAPTGTLVTSWLYVTELAGAETVPPPLALKVTVAVVSNPVPLIVTAGPWPLAGAGAQEGEKLRTSTFV